MKRFASISALVVGTLVAGLGCNNTPAATTGSGGQGNSGNAGGGGAGGEGGTGGDGGMGGGGGSNLPPPPALGPQIDRMGRPAVNTATNHVFDSNSDTKGAAKEAYNEAAPATWATFAPEVIGNLAILDGLDGVCGNQFGANPAEPGPERYATLASALVSDALWVNLDGTCGTFVPTAGYLAVELNALNPALANDDCGGRRVAMDVIDTTYSVVANGSFADVSDGISQDPSKAAGAQFPFLPAPVQ